MRSKKLLREMSSLPDYPSSAATHKQYIHLTLLGAKSTYETLSHFSQLTESKIVNLEDLGLSPTEEKIASKLEELFNFHGSDKANTHNYPRLYAKVIKLLPERSFKIIEIGMGSNNLDTPSNMGAFGRPGASLRAWRDFATNIEVFGGDIDSRILFSESRIDTFVVDQTNQESWEVFLSEVSDEKFDLVVDDGLHSPYANLMTIKNLLPSLSDDGTLIIEDVNESALPVWRIFEKLLPSDYHFRLIEAKNCYAVLIRKSGEFGF